ncbi:MAG: hypothetical protein HUJ68_12895 [Clostridia bacterium]|nr:hypothetical protein [Clostridia bacterium]
MEDKKEKLKINTNIIWMIIAILLIAIFCVSITPVSLQNDTFYTIKIGEHISKNGIDMMDPFSWHENLPYTYPHWLYDFITYLIYSIFGMTGVYVLTCILSSMLGIVLYITNVKLVKNKTLSFVITIGVMYIIRSYIAARAQLVTFILFVLTIFFIEKFLETKKKRYAAGLIVIPILIANLHIAVFPFYFILYLPYFAEYILSILAETIIYSKTEQIKLKNKIKTLSKKPGQEVNVKKLQEKLKKLEEKVDKRKIKRTKELQNPYKIKMAKKDATKWLILIFIICIFTGFLTPLGTAPYTYLIKTMQGNTTQNINEHLPMTLSNETDTLCAIVIFLAVLIFTKVKIRLSDLFMIGGLCYLMLLTKRQMTMFVLIGSFILNRNLSDLVKIYLKKDIDELAKTKLKTKGFIIIAILVIALSCYMVKDKFNEKFIDEKEYPVSACDFILENIDINSAKFYNEYNYGSYLIYRGIPVFIDSRADLYAPEFNNKEDIFMEFIDASSIGTFYEDTMEKYDITHVLTYSNSKMNLIIEKTNPENYRQIYKDDYFVIYERTATK